MRRLEYLYHLAAPENVTSILERGLVSTEQLVGMAGVHEPERSVHRS